MDLVASPHLRPGTQPVSGVEVGGKAEGLLDLPPHWTLPFVAVPIDVVAAAWSDQSDSKSSSLTALVQHPVVSALISMTEQLIVRSSVIDEGIDHRGRYESVTCSSTAADLEDAILEAMRINVVDRGVPVDRLGLVVQEYRSPRRVGHASNERRVSRRHDSWLVEVHDDSDRLIEAFRVADSPARVKGRPVQPFRARRIEGLKDSLRDIVASTSQLGSRGRRHLEWVWDGSTVWVVQQDLDKLVEGGVPGDQWDASQLYAATLEPRVLVDASVSVGDWQKARCVRVFRELDLPTAELFVLEDADVLASTGGSLTLPKDLAADLTAMISAPTVVRTDLLRSVQSRAPILLPRTETCTSIEQLEEFVRKTSDSFREQGLTPDEYCFLFHHFIPARAGSYSVARPGVARVRVDSTWGLPDGLLYLPHDSFEVDLTDPEATWSKIRCKYEYVDCNSDGSWLERTAGPKWDWADSIDRDVLQEVARHAHMIAEHVAAPVEVMHFIDPLLPNLTRCVPWFFRETDAVMEELPRAPAYARRRRMVRDPEDLEDLRAELDEPGSAIQAIGVTASSDYLRDRDFVEQVASIALTHKLPVDLHGSVLAHVFYMLKHAGVAVRAHEGASPPRPAPQRFDKLVRDQIPAKILASGERVSAERAIGSERLRLLKQKVIEEALELFAAEHSEDELEEAADVVEVVLAVIDLLGFTEEQMSEVRTAKQQKLGGFREGVMLRSTYVPSSIPVRRERELFAEDVAVDHVMDPDIELRPSGLAMRLSRVPEMPVARVRSINLSTSVGRLAVRVNELPDRIELEMDLAPGRPQSDDQLSLF